MRLESFKSRCLGVGYGRVLSFRSLSVDSTTEEDLRLLAEDATLHFNLNSDSPTPSPKSKDTFDLDTNMNTMTNSGMENSNHTILRRSSMKDIGNP